jgi:hypothetical protein
MPNQDNRHVPDLEGGLGESFEDRRRLREAETAARAEREPTLRLADATSNVMKSRNQLQKRED